MSVDEYLEKLPDDRRAAISAVRETIRANLPQGYQEGILFGMISYHVPLSRYPKTYNGQPLMIAGLASQKSHMAVYLTSVYGDPAELKWFAEAWKKTGKKLDMGKSCIRFKRLDDLPLPVIGEAIARVPVDAFLKRYEAIRATTRKG